MIHFKALNLLEFGMKKRYLCVFVCAFATGILAFGLPFKIFWAVFSLIFLAGMFLLIKNKKIYIFILSLIFLIGGIYGDFTQNAYKNSPLYEYTKIPCSGKMFVKAIETKHEDYVTVNAVVTEVEGKKINEKVLFTILGINDVRVNSVIHFNDINFKIPDRERNRGGFNYNKYIKSKGIYFTASASKTDLRASGSDGFIILRKLRTFKQKLVYRSEEVFKDSSAKEIMPAILVGNDVLISKQVDGLFKQAGITHILVASGMHVTVVMLLCALILYPLRRFRFIYYTVSCLCLITFAGIVGMHPSIVRATIAYFMYLIARNTLKSADGLTILFTAALVILIINPMSIYNTSFLLSFGAVFGILTFTEHIKRRIKWCLYVPSGLVSLIEFLPIKTAVVVKRVVFSIYNTAVSAMAVSAAAQIGILPIILGTFKSTAVLSIFVNIVISFAIPFLYAFGIAALIFNIQPFVALTEFLCDLFVKGAQITASIPGNNISVASSYLIIAVTVLFVVIFLLRCKTKWTEKLFEPLIFVCLIVALLGNAFYGYIPKDKVNVTFLNVEQGDCAIIRLHNKKTVIVDTGTEKMCSQEVIEFLTREGIDNICALIISHDDSDHSGGIELLCDYMNVEKVITSEFCKTDTQTTIVKKGDTFDIEGAKFTVLSPGEQMYENENESSLVVRMDFGESSFLFTGDIGQETEKTIENVDVDVLKVSHHGSKNSSAKEFVDRVSPLYSVVSVSKSNSYGHPDNGVLKRLKASGSEVLRTDEDFTITFVADLNGEFKLTKGL